ncbi:seryl-tRNA synthetase [Gloeophyllum trabeum ATCC 11539]|uniref:serine--tRNA ligase n=1 Tax=Gloeophyllum trabeum (strain ATCC 11539 / FP-39264 / Madison 617) TaxID=670483 RepID=S7QKQ2_GLOTA|nr:seryl-tRNA synthetase [Gloeophyllum trabeum ATCC 11539]EPQ60371.1 seryl-tRNA synthetase [Gloeophyllum trabeum ATCC 11539]
MSGMLSCRTQRHVVRRLYEFYSRSKNYSTQPEKGTSRLPKPRLDYRGLVEDISFKSHNAFNRKAPLPNGALQSIARLYADQKAIATALNAKRHAQSTIGDHIRASSGDPEAKKAALEDAKFLKSEIVHLEEELTATEDRLLALALAVPNDTHPSSPIGPEDAASVLSIHGPEPIPASSSRDHVSIARCLGLFDLEAAATVTGSSWYYLLNEAALLEMAITNYAMSMAIAHGFTPVTTPDVVSLDIARRCGFTPRDPQSSSPTSQMYHITQHPGAEQEGHHPELVLAGTAEIPLAGMFANKVLNSRELPAKVVGLGKAFRAEAGARGADTRGLYRVHQFTKLELFVVTTQEQSEQMMDEMKQLQTQIFEGLGLTFRVLDMPTEELGASAYRKYDMEAWMPGRGSWGEISSTSNCTDYQSRRLHIRYRPESLCSSSEPKSSSPAGPKTLPFAHTLNGTAAAVPRLIVALLENGARFDKVGNVVGLNLPKALQPFWVGAINSERDIIRWV